MSLEIATVDQLELELRDIQEVADMDVTDGVNELIEQGNELIVYLSRTAKLLGDAKYHRDHSTVKEILQREEIASALPPSAFNELIKAANFRQQYLVNRYERLNRTITHKIDWIRSLVAKEREEMRLQNRTFKQT
jgi:hypothetical protein